MPNDFMTLSALTSELNTLLGGGKIEKIYQPEKDEITLSVRSKGKKFNLVISCNAQNPRIHLSADKKENPITAPPFCMHLRKHINSGIMESISLYNNDRIIDIVIISKNELKDTVKYHLISEMMGRYSNILLVNDKWIITDAVKQVSYDTATKRCILPTMPYSAPEQSKILPCDYEKTAESLKMFTGGSLSKYICSNISGLSPQSAEEIVFRSVKSTDKPLTEDEIIKLIETIKLFYGIYSESLYSPCVSLNEKGEATDYFIMPYKSIDAEFRPTETLCNAIELCVSRKDNAERHREKSKHLYSALKKYKSRNQKKLQKANEKLMECDKMDLYRKYGELITMNLHSIKKGDEYLVTADYYEEGTPNIKIPLNIQLSPSKSAQEYFKKYNKLKRTLTVIYDQINETENLLKYADSIESGLDTSVNTADLLQIEQELYNIGALKKMKSKVSKHIKDGSPIIYEYNDFVICVGKNNIQNDKLTFKTAGNSDMWLHTLNYHGSHTVILTEGRIPPDDVIEFACEITAFHSKGKDNDKVAVDYTYRRYVKRNPDGNLGMVNYTNQKTAYVKPNQHKEFIKI